MALMVSALKPGSRGPGSSRDIVFCSYTRHFTLTVKLTLGLPCDGLSSHPGRSRSTRSRFMPMKPEISAGLMGYSALMQT